MAVRIHNLLPLFRAAMERWTTPPTAAALERDYFAPAQPQLDVIFPPEEARGVAADLAKFPDWADYRESILRLDPAGEEQRLRGHLGAVEQLFGFTLEGEATLFGAFRYMDGYARFDRGTHRVFLGIDESFEDGPYIDILMAHELTHVARESRPTVWQGFGLDPKMSQDEFTERQPMIEHLLGEGLSCAASEIVVPGESAWLYPYQKQDGYERVLARADQVEAVIQRELRNAKSHYGSLYQSRNYGADMPGLTHYVWAWHWARAVARDIAGGDFKALVNRSSHELLEHALGFRLRDAAAAYRPLEPALKSQTKGPPR